MGEDRPDWATCVAEGHWTQIFDSKTQIVELVHDPDDGPCEWQVAEDQQRWSAKEIRRYLKAKQVPNLLHDDETLFRNFMN